MVLIFGKIFLASAVLLVAWHACRVYEAGAVLLSTSGHELRVGAGLPAHWVTYDWGNASWLLEIWRSISDALLGMPAVLVIGFVGAMLWLAGRRDWKEISTSAEEQVAEDAPVTGGQRSRNSSELRGALWSCRSAFLGTGAFSAIINVLMLTGAIFMLEVYDRVLPSRSVATLVALCVVAGILFTALGLLDILRSRLLARAGGALDEALAGRVFDAMVLLPVRAGNRGDVLQPLRDLDTIRAFLSGMGPTALFDLPWLPFYVAIVYAFHPLLGITALSGAIVLIGLTLLTEALVRGPTREMTAHAAGRTSLAEACRRNAEVLAGMGFGARLGLHWRTSNSRVLAGQQRASDIGSGLGAIARVLRMVLQSAVLAVGAYLVVRQEASAGIIIAGAILAARALAPVDVAIGNWRGFVAARQSWQRLSQLLAMLPAPAATMPLPAPSAKLQVENVVAVPPGEHRVTVRDVSFVLTVGQGLGIIGPSGSGKSSLARVLVGAWLPTAGKVRLDGAALDQWAPLALGQHIGYLPQGVELFAGTVAQNISRFDATAAPEAIIEAAKAADVDDLIRNLPNGYDTEIGDGGVILSAGQRQRVALARALYGDPFLVVLDEPDASLDREGEQALQNAVLGVRRRGGIVIVISHRQTILSTVDLLLALEHGRPLAFGPKELVLQRLVRQGPMHVLKSTQGAAKTQARDNP